MTIEAGALQGDTQAGRSPVASLPPDDDREERRRRRQQKALRRKEQQAERARRYRERQKAQREGPPPRASLSVVQNDQQGDQPKQQAPLFPSAEIERKWREALQPTIQTLADTIHAGFLRQDDPVWPEEKSTTLAAAWAPLCAEYLADDEFLKMLPWLFATSVTAQAVSGYANEVRMARAKPMQHIRVPPREGSANG